MTITLINGDCLEELKKLPENSVDSCVTDPPYHLTSIVKRFGKPGSAPAQFGTDGAFARASRGFMGHTWDGGDIAFRPELWAEVLRVLKPGAHLLSFGGTRTYHRMACAIEDAGFEIRDQIQWLYGSGFPKSHSVSKAIVDCLGAEREKIRVTNPRNPKATGGGRDGTEGATRPWIEKAMEVGYHEKAGNTPVTEEATQWDGWGTALKPANEPIVLARKPLSEKTVAENVLRWGTGAINIDACRVGNESITTTVRGNQSGATPIVPQKPDYQGETHVGRWPANVIHDGSDAVLELFPNTAPAKASNRGLQHSGRHGGLAGIGGNIKEGTDSVRGHTDNGGSAARFFYCAKASKKDRDDGLSHFPLRARPTMGSGIGGQPDQQRENNRNNHPTVKPTDLMRYLCRMITPPGGTVLDPFMGSGSTGRGAVLEGFEFVGIELSPEYMEIAKARIEAVNQRAA